PGRPRALSRDALDDLAAKRFDSGFRDFFVFFPAGAALALSFFREFVISSPPLLHLGIRRPLHLVVGQPGSCMPETMKPVLNAGNRIVDDGDLGLSISWPVAANSTLAVAIERTRSFLGEMDSVREGPRVFDDDLGREWRPGYRFSHAAAEVPRHQPLNCFNAQSGIFLTEDHRPNRQHRQQGADGGNE